MEWALEGKQHEAQLLEGVDTFCLVCGARKIFRVIEGSCLGLKVGRIWRQCLTSICIVPSFSMKEKWHTIILTVVDLKIMAHWKDTYGY